MNKEWYASANTAQSEEKAISRRIAAARELQLSDRSTWAEIQDGRLEQERRERADSFGLSKEATWGEIFTAMDEQERQNVATELALDPGTSWRQITAELLGLPGTASDEEMILKIQELGKREEAGNMSGR